MTRLLDDPPHIADNLRATCSLSPGAARDVLEKFDLPVQIDRLDRADLLYLVVSRFSEIDLHPDAVSNLEMGYLYEELIRRFSELSNETAGEHFTPREVIRLMVNLLFINDDRLLTKPGVVKTMLDPGCGTGGMLSVAEDHLRSLNPQARLEVYGRAQPRDLRRLPFRHDAQGARTPPTSCSATPSPTTAFPVSGSTTCSPTRPSGGSGRRSSPPFATSITPRASPAASALGCLASTVALPAIRVGYEEDPAPRLATIEYRSAVEDHLKRDVHPYVPDAWVPQ